MPRLLRDQSGISTIPGLDGLSEPADDISVTVLAPAETRFGPSAHAVVVEAAPDDTRVSVPMLNTPIVYRVTKRAIDIVGAVVGLTLSLPLMLVCAMLIKLHDGGPVLFRQTRVGYRGRLFRIYKLRTMVPNADALKGTLLDQNRHDDNRTFKILNDPRITPIGRVLRRLSLDEVPQFWNVLTGEMSLVGPRPPVPSEVQLYEPQDLKRLAVPPGVTCLWQVSGRSNLDFERQVELDLEYVERRGFWTDLSLLARTLPAVFRGDGAA
jgi:lipopolysaccharide/colanic/teichoic acid biosynthesis glycosyltransferase